MVYEKDGSSLSKENTKLVNNEWKRKGNWSLVTEYREQQNECECARGGRP